MFTCSSARFSQSVGGKVEGEDQRRDAEESGGGDQPEEDGAAATVRKNYCKGFCHVSFCYKHMDVVK